MRILIIIIFALSFSTKSFSFTHDKIIKDLNKAAEQLKSQNQKDIKIENSNNNPSKTTSSSTKDDIKKNNISNSLEKENKKQEQEKVIPINFDLKFCGYKAINNGMAQIKPSALNDSLFETSLTNILRNSNSVYKYRGPFNKTDYINIKSLNDGKISVKRYLNDSVVSENEYKLYSTNSNSVVFKVSEKPKVDKQKYEYVTVETNETIKLFGVLDLNKKIFYDQQEISGERLETRNDNGKVNTKRKTGPNFITTAFLKCASNEEEIKVAKNYYESLSKSRLAKIEQKKKDQEQREAVIKAMEDDKKFFETPEGQLVDGYLGYIILQKFYNARKGYDRVYINNQKMSEIKNKIKEIEKFLVKKNNLNSDSAWTKANEYYKKLPFSTFIDTVETSGSITNDALSVSKMTLIKFEELYKKIVNSGPIKKNF